MSRLVRAATDGNSILTFSGAPVEVKLGSPGAPPSPGPGQQTTQVDNYAARLVKYIPAEIVAVYLAADKLFTSVTTTSEKGVTKFIDTNGLMFSLGIFVLLLAVTPVYCWQQSEKGQPWTVHAAISTVAFAIWAYASQGAVFYAGYQLYDNRLASLLIIMFTFLSGFVIPTTQPDHSQGVDPIKKPTAEGVPNSTKSVS